MKDVAPSYEELQTQASAIHACLEALQSAADRAPGAEGKTVLLVDDSGNVRTLIATLLRGRGYNTIEADNGLAALQRAQEHAGPIHLLVTDVVMPGMGGCELAERLAEIRPSTRVLYLSGYLSADLVLSGAAIPARAFLNKPFTLDELLKKVREVLDR